MTALRFSAGVYKAMAEQLTRVNSDETPEETIERLQRSVTHWKAEFEIMQKRVAYWMDIANNGTASDEVAEVHEATGTTLNGRPVGNQSEFARLHHVPAYQVCRWCKDGDVQFMRRGGKYLVYLDQPCPPAKQPGRRKSS